MRPSEYWSMKLVPYALFALSCFLEGFFWLEENQPGVPAVTPKKQGERAVSK